MEKKYFTDGVNVYIRVETEIYTASEVMPKGAKEITEDESNKIILSSLALIEAQGKEMAVKKSEESKANYEALIKEGNSPTLAKLVSGYNPEETK